MPKISDFQHEVMDAIGGDITVKEAKARIAAAKEILGIDPRDWRKNDDVRQQILKTYADAEIKAAEVVEDAEVVEVAEIVECAEIVKAAEKYPAAVTSDDSYDDIRDAGVLGHVYIIDAVKALHDKCKSESVSGGSTFSAKAQAFWGMATSTASEFLKIANSLSYSEFRGATPSVTSTRLALAKLDDDVVRENVESGAIHPRMTTAEAKALGVVKADVEQDVDDEELEDEELEDEELASIKDDVANVRGALIHAYVSTRHSDADRAALIQLVTEMLAAWKA